jgi:protein-S-isoprenylcysteine O-methyltransferase Ste14
MSYLELKIPPPLIALLLAIAMWGLADLEPRVETSLPLRRAMALVIAVAGAAFDVLAVLAFLKSRTTINPMAPGRTSTFIARGPYRITRNPMYVGLVLLLVAWAVFLGALWPIVGPVFFVLYVTRFQIEPEERILCGLFGDEYRAYMTRVRRWL